MKHEGMKKLIGLAPTIMLVSFVTAVAITAAPQADPKVDQIAALITQKMTEYNVPGVAFGMIKDGKVTARGFGVTNVDTPQPITPETIFALASISKTVTTTAMMRLVEQGKVDLNAPVRKYLPEFKLQDESAAATVTVLHLLTHTPGWEGQLTPADKGVDTLSAFVDTMKDLPQLAPPGAVWSYNNAGFSVAGRVIEVVTGQNIHDALRTLVFQPIGLTRAFTRLEDVASFPFSVAHQQRNGATAVTRPLMKSSSVTAGGVSMSLRDVLTYGSFHLGDGMGADGKPVLSRASLELMRTARIHKAGTDDDMGIGWHLRNVGGVLTAAHGGTLGHCLLLQLVPSRHLAFAILTNHSDGWKLVQDVERATLRLMEGLTVEPTQALAHRGVNETMADVPLFATPPDPAPYVGTYRRPPSGMNTVSLQNGQLMLDRNAIAFYGVDRAVVTSGNAKGNPIEFVRKADGTIGWIRYVGRIARKD